MWYLFAQQAASDQGLVEYIQYGVLGLVVVAFLVGLIWPKPSVERIIKDKEALERQRDALLLMYEKEVIPALQEVTKTVTPAMTELSQAVRDLRIEVSDMRRRGEA